MTQKPKAKVTRKQSSRQALKQLQPVINGIQSHTSSPKGLDRGVHVVVTVVLRLLSYLIVFILGAAMAGVATVFAVAVLYLRTVSSSSGISVDRLVALTKQHESTYPANDRTTVLVLGTDALANRDEQSKLTDTIMIASIVPSQGKMTTFSIPRDLWIASQSSKMNGLYQRDEKLPAKVVQDITGVRIDRQVVIDISTVGKLIDALGGLNVTVERSFVDYRFPRSDVDVRTERDPNKLYETVAFTKGVEHMSGDRALRYIRSRHSPDPVEGTDDARVRRQQQVISALLSKVQDPMLARNPEQIGSLLALYENDVHTDLTLEQLATIGWRFVDSRKFPHLKTYQFTVREVDKNGQITHPTSFPGGIWVYLPVDPTYKQFKRTVEYWLQ